MVAQIEDLNEDFVRTIFSKKHVIKERYCRAGLGRFIVLNDSASPNTLFQFFLTFLKVLELFECRRGDPYKTGNRNIVLFAHS